MTSGDIIIITTNFSLQQLTAKLTQAGMHNPSSPDSSSGSSTGSLHNVYDGPNAEAEGCLPGVVGGKYFCFLVQISNSVAVLSF